MNHMALRLALLSWLHQKSPCKTLTLKYLFALVTCATTANSWYSLFSQIYNEVFICSGYIVIDVLLRITDQKNYYKQLSIYWKRDRSPQVFVRWVKESLPSLCCKRKDEQIEKIILPKIILFYIPAYLESKGQMFKTNIVAFFWAFVCCFLNKAALQLRLTK